MRFTETPSPNHGPRPDGAVADMLIIHYTGLQTCDQSLARLCDPSAEVSAHYLISEEGEIFALVPEDRRAWHAGVSFWRGDADINSRSIGIELQNPGHEYGYRAFPAAQMASLVELGREITGRYPVPGRHVLGHSDISPERKQDPGELFDWAGLAAEGIGLWSGAAPDLSKLAQGIQMTQVSGTSETVDEERSDDLTQSLRELREVKDKTHEFGPPQDLVEGAEKLSVRGSDVAQLIQKSPEIAAFQTLLQEFGYAPALNPGVLDDAARLQVLAFQRHFQPENLYGVPDQETLARLNALLALV